jgi:hypothetical protein
MLGDKFPDFLDKLVGDFHDGLGRILECRFVLGNTRLTASMENVPLIFLEMYGLGGTMAKYDRRLPAACGAAR